MSLARGAVERIGPRAQMHWSIPGAPDDERPTPVDDHGQAVRVALAVLRERGLLAGERLAVGHRIVHGGTRFVEPTLVDAEVLAAIEELRALAPLHNTPALAALTAATAELGPDVPAVAVFDTTFHRHLPPRAARYAIPAELGERHGIRRVGFHGLAHRWMSERHALLTGDPRARLVTVQLGQGCSCCAVDAGRSVEVSMGFSPLEGMMMGTRSGNVDPALVPYLARREGLSLDEIEELLNQRSGLLGVSARSADMRDLLAATDEASALAVEMFVHRARMAIGAQLAALGGADALIFGGGIGERSAAIRARIAEGLAWCGLALDPDANAGGAGERRISAPGARLAAWVTPVREETLIARDTAALVAGEGPTQRGS